MKARNSFIWGVLFVLFALLPSQVSAKSSFTDVPDRHWAKDAIEWAKNEGLTSGYQDGTFRPDQSITEAQLVTMLVRFDCTSPSSFEALPGEHKAMGNYRYLRSHFLPLNGFSNRYARDASVKRADAARIFSAYQGVDVTKHEAVYYLYVNDMANGITGKNDYLDFGPNNELTRAETVTFLYNMSLQQGCELQGLNSKATGKHNAKYSYPANFVKDDEINFEKPNQPSQPGIGGGVKPPTAVEVDIEKPVLTANGKDSTFITFTFRDCNGELIPYERELEFEVSSQQEASFKILEYPTLDNKYDGQVSTVAETIRRTHRVRSDGPEVTVKVIAPKTKERTLDTITVTPVDKTGNCTLPSATATLTYEPKAEVQLDVVNNPWGQTTVTATLVRPGGERIYGFNGYLKLESSSGRIPFNDSYPNFYNGVATTTFTTPRYLLKDEITAKAISRSTTDEDAIYSILNKSFTVPVSFSPPITVDTTCTAEKPEIGFLIDSSGSMKRNDEKWLRVTKTTEFIRALNAEENIATHFTTSGMFLKSGAPEPVINSLVGVKANGGTNIADGLHVALNKFTTKRQRVLILLTDGKSSKTPILKQVEEAKRQGIRIFTIGLGKDLDEALLKDIARETKGSYFHVKENIELSLVYQSILQEINCGIPLPTCSVIASVFNSPSVKLTNRNILMETEVSNACGTINKVIVRFSSQSGDLDYELAHRGHNFYMMNKGLFEIQDFQLAADATFIAYDLKGKEIARQKVKIQK
ncbi:VWA domain-containing protein [Sporosarcina aquimarina]|uniref:VWA domain-containing protein n=1 Tax=Sporosarcina aquimarina TaxID=114975 RepID=UPI001C8EEC31|nr:S-layer homology domain-containing protein [Sporosarcina aquimarina]MBY0221477.1 S-layer homology domain-containing protein [Sporosarcina aquimarina]